MKREHNFNLGKFKYSNTKFGAHVACVVVINNMISR